MKSPLVSIIIPVYGAENYLCRCLDSIQRQTFMDWECILVDDGSIDRSGIICDEYTKKDGRFRVFHKENGGVSSARQYGVERTLESGAKYSIHADPDDWVEPMMLERLYNKAEETDADMVICDFYLNTATSQIYKTQNPKSDNPNKVLNALFTGLHGSLWNKLIKTSCYKEANIRFPEGLNYCEDYYVNVCLLLKGIHKVSYLPEAFYHYDLFSNNSSETRVQDILKMNGRRYKIVELCRETVPTNRKKWQYYLFEIYHAYRVLKSGISLDKSFFDFFSDIPLNILLHPHKRYIHTFITVFVTHFRFDYKKMVYIYNRINGK